jgi:autotransporter adhesin
VGSAAAERQITNVAAATADTDAVNKGQMDAADAATLTSANTYTNTRTAATLSSANAYTDMKLQSISLDFTNFQNDVSNRFDETDKSINRVGSLSAAMAQMSSAAAGNRNTNRVAVGVGNYNGETSLAVGYQRTVSEKVTITFGGAFGGNENMVGGGASLGW